MKTVLFYPRIEKNFRSSYAPLGIMSIATYSAGIEFLRITYYANFFPNIKKKYNISK